MRIARLFPKQPPHSSQNTVFFRVVRVVFRRYLKHSGEGILKLVDRISNCLSDMLVDEHNANVFPLLGKPVEGRLDGGSLSFAVTNKEISLRVRRVCNVADTR